MNKLILIVCLLITISTKAQFYHVGDSVYYPGTTRIVVVDKILLGNSSTYVYADSIPNPPPFDVIVLFKDSSYSSTIAPVSIGNYQEVSPATLVLGPLTVPPPALVMNPFYSGMPIVCYSQRVYKGMTYFILAATGHGNFPGGLAIINLTMDSLNVANIKRQLALPTKLNNTRKPVKKIKQLKP